MAPATGSDKSGPSASGRLPVDPGLKLLMFLLWILLWLFAALQALVGDAPMPGFWDS